MVELSHALLLIRLGGQVPSAPTIFATLSIQRDGDRQSSGGSLSGGGTCARITGSSTFAGSSIESFIIGFKMRLRLSPTIRDSSSAGEAPAVSAVRMS